jgi:hypothetical protein
VWQEFGLVWRWRYLEPGEHLVLTCNSDYPGEQEATAAARAAYPGVSIGPGRPPPGLELPAAPVTRLPRPLTRTLLVAAWVVVVRLLRRSGAR